MTTLCVHTFEQLGGAEGLTRMKGWLRDVIDERQPPVSKPGAQQRAVCWERCRLVGSSAGRHYQMTMRRSPARTMGWVSVH